MPSYDVTNVCDIDAQPEVIWDALVAELNGARRWWVPYNTYRPGSVPPEVVDGTVEWTIHVRGADRSGPKLRFTAVTREVQPGRRLAFDYVAGVFSGSGNVQLEPLDGDRTRVSLRWQTRPRGWMHLLARLVDPGAKHRQATNEALANLATLVTKRQPQTGAGSHA